MSFFDRSGDTLHRWGSSTPNFTPISATIRDRTPKLKILLKFDQVSEYKRPAGAYHLRNFRKICRVYTSFQDALTVKIWMDLLKRLRSYGNFNLRGRVFPKYSAPLAAKLCVGSAKIFEVQERALDPLSPYQVWWGSDFTRRRGGQKR